MTAVIVAGVLAVGLWWEGTELQTGWIRYVSIAAFVLVVANLAWTRLLWRVRPFQLLAKVPPNVLGTWKCELRSEWVNPETGEGVPPKIVYLVVRQTLDDVKVKILTDESSSVSTAASVTRDADGCRLTYVYRNEPDSSVNHRSAIHYGGTNLTITGAPGRRLRGRYWTDRSSRGELESLDHRRKATEDFQDAASLFT